jgi:ubiquinone/menaquinone biosynthesis C-methylase UbiE
MHKRWDKMAKEGYMVESKNPLTHYESCYGELFGKIYYKKVKEALVQVVSLKDKEVMEAGCGNGFLSTISAESAGTRIKYGVDFSFELLRYGKGKYESLICADMCNLPFEDDSFDIILSSEVIAHIPNEEAMIMEVHRVLNDEGLFVLSTPNRGGIEFIKRIGRMNRMLRVKKRDENVEESTVYFKPLFFKELEQMVSKAGFEIMKHKTVIFAPPNVDIMEKKFKPIVKLFGLVNDLGLDQLPIIRRLNWRQIIIAKKGGIK